MPDARATIIVLCWNRWALTQRCLETIFRHTDPAQAEVLVVDNGSSDETPVRLRSFEGIRVLRHETNLEFYDVGARFSLLPFQPIGRDHFWYGAFELGFEPLYQHYTTPKQAFWGGLSAVVRYHFLALGRVVPYVEIAGSAGGTDLDIPEIRSAFAFLLFGGVGASVFVSDKTALYAGYRYQHVSNGNTSQPNRGFEASVVVGGLSFYFP